MGNCAFRGFASVEEVVIKVVTLNGGVMELYPPITAECITNEFPGHAIFRSRDIFSPPLLHSEELLPREHYYLLPNRTQRGPLRREDGFGATGDTTSVFTPYRMSFDSQGLWRRADTEMNPRIGGAPTGMWKVKLVISPEQLAEILSQEARTEALIESVRTVAKCGSGVPSAASSDQGSIASSWKASSEFMA